MGSTLKLLSCKPGLTSGLTHDITPTSASAKGWLIKNIFFYNAGASQLTLSLKVRQTSGGTSRMLVPSFTVPAGGSAVFERDIALDLNVPDILSVVLSGTSLTTDCTITGTETDQ